MGENQSQEGLFFVVAGFCEGGGGWLEAALENRGFQVKSASRPGQQLPGEEGPCHTDFCAGGRQAGPAEPWGHAL